MGIVLNKRSNLVEFSQIPVGTIFIPDNENDVYIKVLKNSKVIDNGDIVNEIIFNSVCLSNGALINLNSNGLVSYLKEDFYIDRSLFDEG